MPLSADLTAVFETWYVDLDERRHSANTVATYRYTLEQFQRWLAAQPDTYDVADLDVATCSRFVAHLKERKLQTHTILDYIGVLTRWIAFLVNEGDLPQGVRNARGKFSTPAGLRDRLERMVDKRTPPVAPIIPDLRDLLDYYPNQLAAWQRTPRHHGVSPAQPTLFRAYLNLLRNHALVSTLFSSGGRINEVLALETRTVVKQNGVQHAVPISGKGRKQRPLRLDDDARRAIEVYLAARQPLFPGAAALFISHGPRGAGHQMSDVTGWRVVKAAAEDVADHWQAEGRETAQVLALRDVSPHSIRHYVAQYMLLEGADYKDIAAIFGHSSSVVTEQVYARFNDERMIEVADTFAPRRKRSGS